MNIILPRRGNALFTGKRTRNRRSVPTKTPSSQAARSHTGKAKSYEPKALNELMLPMRIKKSLIIHQLQPNRKNEDVRKGGDLYPEQKM